MGRRPTTELTPRQRETLDWVKGFIVEHGLPPTVREIGRAFGIKSSSVFSLLQALQRKGHLRRGKLGARSLIVRDEPKHLHCGCQEVPVVGRIAAGRPIEAIEHDRGTVVVRRALLRGREGYALKIEGTSMVDAGILDGDWVIVRRQDTAEDGDIVVALIGEEATLKRFFREKRRIRLEPANKGMQPIYVDRGEFRIQGKVVGVQRVLDR
jgi:repressor LexA